MKTTWTIFFAGLALANAFTPFVRPLATIAAEKSLRLPTLASNDNDQLLSSLCTKTLVNANIAPAYVSSNTRLMATIPDLPDQDLLVGYATIVMACTPYVLSLFFPDFFLKAFFLPVYNDDKEGREAEIGWKARYATLGLVLTTLVGLEVWLAPERVRSGFDELRDAYIVWTLFYTEATLKIRREYDEGILGQDRWGIQLWHSLVTIVLWADVSQSPLAQSIIDWILDVYHEIAA